MLQYIIVTNPKGARFFRRFYYMKVVGQIRNICGKNCAVMAIDAGQLPRLHSEVVDRHNKPVGKLVEVFGNIKTPYALVVCKGQCKCSVGDQLYTE